MNRRAFLRCTAGGAAAVALGPAAARLARAPAVTGVAKRPWEAPRLVILLFGGGTRSADTFEDPGHRYIPRLGGEMAPQGTLFTNLRVEGKVVHPNSAGSIVTGHWEWDDLDWSHPVQHPTLFEILRRTQRLPDTAAWAFVYASILAQIGHSQDAAYGAGWAANVVEPPTIPRSTAEAMDQLLRGSPPDAQPAVQEANALVRATSRISRSGLRSPAARRFIEDRFRTWQRSGGTTSHDAFLAECALACMRQFAPRILLVAFGEIDCAHYGAWSRYTDAIRRTDELTWRLWRAAEESPAYRGQTLFLVLPDHGRELERAGGPGFIHHSDFYSDADADEGCRRVWMLALGPGVPPGRRIETPTPLTSVAATGLEYLGLTAVQGAAHSVWPRITAESAAWATPPESRNCRKERKERREMGGLSMRSLCSLWRFCL